MNNEQWSMGGLARADASINYHTLCTTLFGIITPASASIRALAAYPPWRTACARKC